MEHTNHIKNLKRNYSTFRKNSITLQTPSKWEFQLQSKYDFQNHSSSETVFHHAAEDYDKALEKSRCNVKLQDKPTNQNINNKINCKRNILPFNPRLIKTVSTKIGHYFLNLLDKHFPKNRRLNSIFNGNNIKLSYSCTKNIKSIITNHNKTTINKSETLNKKKCNCINKNTCPLNRECQTENHLATTNTKTKQNFQRKYGILSQQITAQKLRGKPYEDAHV